MTEKQTEEWKERLCEFCRYGQKIVRAKCGENIYQCTSNRKSKLYITHDDLCRRRPTQWQPIL